jgi:4-amino-4-deoxy-L-arabinose transferase-like glycosyltransferase
VALLAIPWVWQQRREVAIRFCLAWLIPAWLVFEAIPTKLPHYSLPTYPAIALLAAAALMAGGVRLGGLWSRLALGWWLLVTLALATGLGSFGFVIDGRPLWGSILAGVAAVVLGVAAIWLLLRDRRQLLVAVLAGLVIPVYGFAFQMALPASDGFWLSRAAGRAVAAAGAGDRPLVAAAGYTEPSLVFALGTATRFVRGAGAADLLADNEVALALVETAHQADFARRATERGLVLAAPVVIEGYNYSRGKRTVLMLYRKAAP